MKLYFDTYSKECLLSLPAKSQSVLARKNVDNIEMFKFNVHTINSYLIICQIETNNHSMMKEKHLLNCKWRNSFEFLQYKVYCLK